IDRRRRGRRLHRAVREGEVAVRADADRCAVRDREPALFRRVVRPERRRRLVWNETRRRLARVLRIHAACRRQLRRNGRGRCPAGRGNDLMQAAVEDVDNVELAVIILTEGRKAVVGEIEQLLERESTTARDETPDAAANVVAEYVLPHEPGQRAAAVYVAAGDGRAECSIVVVHGLVEHGTRRATTRGRLVEGDGPLAAVPAVVSAQAHAIDFLAKLLTYVAEPKIARGGVEAPTPGIAEARRIDLRTALCATCRRTNRVVLERISLRARWNHIRRLRRCVPHVQAHEVAHQVVGILATTSRVETRPSVTEAEIEKPVGAERYVPALVIGSGRLVDLKDVQPARRIERRATRRNREPRDERYHRRTLGERQVHESVGRIVRIERHTEQAALNDAVHRKGNERGSSGIGAVREHANGSRLLDNEPARVVPGRLQHRERLIEPKARKHALQLDPRATWIRLLRGGNTGEIRRARVEPG